MTAPHRSTSSAATTVLWITYVNITLYALSYQLQRPVEPFLVQSLTEGKDDAAVAYGHVQSFFSLLQTVGSPLVGILLDRIGIRRTSALVFACSALSYAILAHATSLGTLFLSKVPAAMQHAFLVGQATAATCATTAAAGGGGGDKNDDDDEDSVRAQALGRMTTAYTIGATVGPALGGYLAHGDEKTTGDLYLGARLAVVGSLVSAALSWAFLPDEQYHAADDNAKGSGGNDGGGRPPSRTFLDDVRRSAAIASRSHLWPLLLVKIVGGMARSMHSTALPLALTQSLNVDPSQLGGIMSASMFSVAAFGAVALRPCTSLLGTGGLARAGLALRGVMAFFIAYVVTTAAVVAKPTSVGMGTEDGLSSPLVRIVAASVVHALASHALATSLTTMTTGTVAPSERGALLGLEHGLFSAVGVVGPTAGTALLALGGTGGEGSFWSVALACASIDAVLVGALSVWGLQQGLSWAEQGKMAGTCISGGKEEHSD